jgi:hypothetical protein
MRSLKRQLAVRICGPSGAGGSSNGGVVGGAIGFGKPCALFRPQDAAREVDPRVRERRGRVEIGPRRAANVHMAELEVARGDLASAMTRLA